MPEIRQYPRVPATATRKRSAKIGRPPKPDAEKMSHVVKVSLTARQYEAFQSFIAKESLTSDAAAGCKIFLDRLKSEGLL